MFSFTNNEYQLMIGNREICDVSGWHERRKKIWHWLMTASEGVVYR